MSPEWTVDVTTFFTTRQRTLMLSLMLTGVMSAQEIVVVNAGVGGNNDAVNAKAHVPLAKTNGTRLTAPPT